MLTSKLEKEINAIWKTRDSLSSKSNKKIINTIDKTIDLIDKGKIRVAEKTKNKWKVNEWIKKAILLSFRVNEQKVISNGPGSSSWWDKVPSKFSNWKKKDFKKANFRVVPNAVVRKGTHIEENVVLMPSFINIGAYVGSETMIDTWATVGSCAQIGKNVHLSGGVGIGGVLEPLQASPVIIEDNVFIGSRCIVVEGVHIKKEAVLGANVVLTKSTKIFDVSKKEAQEIKGFIPERSVVIPGSYKKEFNAGEFNVPCALIIGERKESTDKKTSLNDVLREHGVSV